MYHKNEELNLENVIGLFVVCHKYEFHFLKNKCQEFILEHVTNDNSSILLQISKTYEWKELYEKCLNLMYSVFEKIENIGDLSYEDLKNILSSDKLNVLEEINVFHKIEEWVLFDEKERQNQMFELFDLVDYTSIENEKIVNIESKLSLNDSISLYLFKILQKKIKDYCKTSQEILVNFLVQNY